jgi:hypothetical protein
MKIIQNRKKSHDNLLFSKISLVFRSMYTLKIKNYKITYYILHKGFME